MELHNFTPYPAFPSEHVSLQGGSFYVVAIRATFDLRRDGSWVSAAKQVPLVLLDEHYEKNRASSVRMESDSAPFKPKSDVVVIGNAYAPGGAPLGRFQVRLVMRDKRLTITGPRFFKKKPLPNRAVGSLLTWSALGFFRFNPWRLSRSEKIAKLPLRYEYAFGGEVRVMISDQHSLDTPVKHRSAEINLKTLIGDFITLGKDAPVCQRTWQANPVGVGFAPYWWLNLTKVKRLAAPQIERSDRPITAKLFWKQARGKASPWDPDLAPHGFGFIGKSWLYRIKNAGTYDELWRKKGYPNQPDDFNPAYWNGAHPDLQVPNLQVGTWMEVTNLLPESSPWIQKDEKGNNILRFQIPDRPLTGLINLTNGQTQPSDPQLDTLVLDLCDVQKPILNLTYRICLDCEREGLNIKSYELR